MVSTQCLERGSARSTVEVNRAQVGLWDFAIKGLYGGKYSRLRLRMSSTARGAALG